MSIEDCSKYMIAIMLLALSFGDGIAQSTPIHSDRIEPLIDEWNFANNTQNLHSFEAVYGPRVTLQEETVSKRTAVARKQQLFGREPGFRQRITSEIRYTPLSNNVTKCEFTTEAYEGSTWRKYTSYLLVGHANNRYSIVGEGRAPLKKGLQKKPKPEAPIAAQEDSSGPPVSGSAYADTLPALPAMEDPDSIDPDYAARPATQVPDTAFGLSDLEDFVSNLSPTDVVTVPRGYVFILVGMLGLGGLMIFVADSVQSGRRRRVKFSPHHAEAAHVVQDYKIQAAFEAFVVTLFDPLYFKCFRPKAEHVYAGNGIASEKGPDLILDYHHKETSRRFAITCQYYKHTARNEVQLLSADRQQQIRQFEADREMDVYYVLGFGGRPDDPRELFFVPASDVRSEYMTRGQLRRYTKSGMFYYNRRTERIQ